jgi:hypothetical protein
MSVTSASRPGCAIARPWGCWRCVLPLADLPDVLTVAEAAAVLRIGRGAAYELARQWRKTAGQEGLPVIVLGRRLRVPRVALERLLAGEPQPVAHLRPVEHNQGWPARAQRFGA